MMGLADKLKFIRWLKSKLSPEDWAKIRAKHKDTPLDKIDTVIDDIAKIRSK